jgi:hypothetical protein
MRPERLPIRMTRSCFFNSFMGVLLGYVFTHVFLDKIPDQSFSNHSLDAYVETFLWGVLSHRGEVLRREEM